jgi:hypothetical protein
MTIARAVLHTKPVGVYRFGRPSRKWGVCLRVGVAYLSVSVIRLPRSRRGRDRGVGRDSTYRYFTWTVYGFSVDWWWRTRMARRHVRVTVTL